MTKQKWNIFDQTEMENFLHIIFTTRTRDCVLSEGQPGKTLRSKFIRSNYCSQSRLSFNEKVPGLPALQIVIEKQAASCLYSGKCCRPHEGRAVSQCDTSCSSTFLKSYIYITFVVKHYWVNINLQPAVTHLTALPSFNIHHATLPTCSHDSCSIPP